MSRESNNGLMYGGTGVIAAAASIIITTVVKLGLYSEAQRIANTLLKENCGKEALDGIKNILDDLGTGFIAGISAAGGTVLLSITVMGLVYLLQRKNPDESTKVIAAKAFVIAGISMAPPSALISLLEKFVLDAEIANGLQLLENSQLCNATMVSGLVNATDTARTGNITAFVIGIPFAALGIGLILHLLYKAVIKPSYGSRDRERLIKTIDERNANCTTDDDDLPSGPSERPSFQG